tara:strand:- start:306 stop:419 length:114 start_codon:yes stop_codon:yes gene_type:complete
LDLAFFFVVFLPLRALLPSLAVRVVVAEVEAVLERLV